MFKIKIFLILSIGLIHTLNGAASKNAKQKTEPLLSAAQKEYGSASQAHTKSREVEMRALKLLAVGTFERVNDSDRPNDNHTEVFIQFSHATAGEALSISQWIGKKPSLSCEKLNKDGKTTTIVDPKDLKKECELLDKVHTYFKALDTKKLIWWSYESNDTVMRTFKVYEDHTIEHSNS
jgi:hypothetical protein